MKNEKLYDEKDHSKSLNGTSISHQNKVVDQYSILVNSKLVGQVNQTYLLTINSQVFVCLDDII